MPEDRQTVDIAQLVRDHYQVVFRCAYRLTGTVPDAEDLTQQVFLLAQQKLGQVRKIESLRSWLLIILKNCFLKSCQRKRTTPPGGLRVSVDTIPARAAWENGIDQERLQSALDQLPPHYRLVLVLFYFQECSYREIAEQLHMPMGTVMSRLARAKGYLRAKLFELERAAGARSEKATAIRRG